MNKKAKGYQFPKEWNQNMRNRPKLDRRPWRCNHIITIQSTNRNNSQKLWMSYQTYRGCSGISVRMWFIHFWMTTWQKSPTSGSSIHPRLGEVKGADRASQALSNIPQTPEYKRIVWTINSTYRKHTRNNKTYMCLYESMRSKQ